MSVWQETRFFSPENLGKEEKENRQKGDFREQNAGLARRPEGQDTFL